MASFVGGTLTSTKVPGNKIYLNFPQQQGVICGTASYTVKSGTGKFAKATGGGTVTFKCDTDADTYSDQWSGTLYY